MKKVAIIGAGVAGLGTAALLARKGYEVRVFEKNRDVGGRARVWKSQGFTFDMGPSWYMMPDAFENYFGLFGKRVRDMYQLVRLDPHYEVVTGSGKRYVVRKDLHKNIEMFNRNESGGGEKLVRFLDKSRYLYEKSMQNLVYEDYRSLWNLLRPEISGEVLKLDLLRSFHQSVAGYFKNRDLQKILEFTTVFLGGSPYNTPAFYNLIAHADFNLGIWYPMGGMGRVPQALANLTKENHGKIQTRAAVVKILTKNGQVRGVKTEAEDWAADAVVAACDYRYAETQLLEPRDRSMDESYWKRKVLAPSALVIYLGLRGKVKNLPHHLLYFDDSWERHFDQVYKDPQWPENPSYYVHCPSKTDPGTAPPGCDAVMILVPVSAGLSDTEVIRQKYFHKVVKHFEGVTGQKLGDKIVTKRIFAHRDFAADYNAYQGTAFGLAHTLGQTAVFRPRNYSRRVKGLYYAGQYTNPGVGVPTGLISARITAGLVEKEI